MNKNILVSAGTTLFVLLLVFHPWIALAVAYGNVGLGLIHAMGTQFYSEPFSFPKDNRFEMFFVFLFFILFWPVFAFIILVAEEAIRFHKPITFHKIEGWGKKNETR